MPTKPAKVAIYLEGSNDDRSQETGNQLPQLRGFSEVLETRAARQVPSVDEAGRK
jgi:hypothetical protein